MPKTKHPKDVARLTGDILLAEGFTQGTNDERNNSQISMTLKVTGQDDMPLGSRGETVGYSKSIDTSGTAPKGTGRLYEKRAPGNDCALVTRQVASYQTDKLLGLNSVAEERYGRDRQGNVIGVSIQADGCNVVSNRGVLQVDCSDPRIQRGLSDLQTSDFITGQLDRHAGNIFIDPATGKVTGIDNNLSFPERPHANLDETSQERFVGMPKTMHRETADKSWPRIPEALRKLLSTPPPQGGPSPLPPKSIDEAVNRLKALQTELQPGGSVRVVNAFDRTTNLADLNDAHQALQREQQEWLAGAHKNAQEGRPLKQYLVPPGSVGSDQIAAMSLEDKQRLYPRLIDSFSDAKNKTSYIATVELELEKNRAIAGLDQHLMTNSYAPPANRSAQTQLERKLGDAYRELPKVQQKLMDSNIEALNKLESQLETKIKHLDHPSAVDRLNSLFKGSSSVMHMKQVHANDLAQEIVKAKAKLEKQADEVLQLKAQKSWVRPLDDTATPMVSHGTSVAPLQQPQPLIPQMPVPKPQADLTGNHSPDPDSVKTKVSTDGQKQSPDHHGDHSPDADEHSEHESVRQMLAHQQEHHAHGSGNHQHAGQGQGKDHHLTVSEDAGLTTNHRESSKQKQDVHIHV